MRRITRIFLLAILAHIGRHSFSSSAAPLENPFPLGTIGCLASDVCGPEEVCKDDLLFGSCQPAYGLFRGSQGRYGGRSEVFRLGEREVEELEAVIWSLIRDGFTWQDAFTQCTLQNLLLAFQRPGPFSPGLCEAALGVSLPAASGQKDPWSRITSQDIASVLRKLFQRGRSVDDVPTSRSTALSYPRMTPDQAGESRLLRELLRREEEEEEAEEEEEERQAEYDGQSFYPQDFESLEPLDSAKRDEFVQLHKYYDKSKGQLKRDSLLVQNPYNYLDAFPQQSMPESQADYEQSPGDYDQRPGDYEQRPGDYDQKPDSLGPDGEVKEEAGKFFDLPPGEVKVKVEEEVVPGLESSMGGEHLPDSTEQLVPAEATEELLTGKDLSEPQTGEGEEGEDEGDPDKELSLSPRDEQALEQLLEGSLEPTDLPVEQQRRLSRFIEIMISMLELRGRDHLSDVEVLQTPPSSQEEPGAAEDPQYPTAQLLPEASSDDDNNEGDMPISDDANQDDGGAADVIPEEGKEGEVELDKKSAPEHPPEDGGGGGGRGKAVVHTDYTYIKLNNQLNQSEARLFVGNLTDMLHVPQGIAHLNQVEGDTLILKVEVDPRWNSSKIAREAQEHSEALYQETGLKVVDAGIGKGVTVEVERRGGGRQLVLTLVLVGSIAGVVLAVTLIYLLKRHRRSRDKLAQLAATGDGNEASKDYQDLCRQRMQAKSSEKPEPLHAASRIGSVSEQQVRSPSSRSSTSSWSEEPAASNMDISTGHVVLAYMEDHLKNQDRLDQEWEALAAYQADPCTTAIASDANNARKNRYSDVLPYDHSRVVMSAGTNVSNSDYVNASFITDHDPRNPAYICTQGPLPHTVADFWQMVWEQGSVVIVMLTKLTENGTAMCHRYWPEEGSDLYHIYEVHLVSEHIWCDDYLVRSFYLKNLQTNETRTVTQFHFLTWSHLNVPPSIKALLDFRRKVNKSFRGGSCPIVLHCNDGCGRSGTYCLMDMVLNRMAKGAKEIDMAATLEHCRDQRMNMVQTKEQFQFALSAVAEEVHAILKALPQ